jgi:hypothetical protein
MRLAARVAVHLGDELQDLAAAQVIVVHRIVGQVADAALHLGAVAVTVEAVDAHAAAARHQDAHHHADGGGLACAVRAEEAEHLARIDREREIGDGVEAAVALAEGLEFDHGWPAGRLLRCC